MLCEIIYGARLDNEIDVKILRRLTENIVNSNGPNLPSIRDYPDSERLSRKEGIKYLMNLPIAQTGIPLGLAKNADRALTSNRFKFSINLLQQLDRAEKSNSIENWTRCIDNIYKQFTAAIGYGFKIVLD